MITKWTDLKGVVITARHDPVARKLEASNHMVVMALQHLQHKDIKVWKMTCKRQQFQEISTLGLLIGLTLQFISMLCCLMKPDFQGE